jgi:hypothetical protein
MLLGRALRCVVWKGRRAWVSAGLLGGVGWENAMAVAGSAREVRAEAERPARAVGTRALCAIVSDMVGQQPQVCLPLAWLVCRVSWLWTRVVSVHTELEFWRSFVTELLQWLPWLQWKTHQVARRRQCLLLADPPLAAGIGLGCAAQAEVSEYGVDSYRRKSRISDTLLCILCILYRTAAGSALPRASA